MLQGQRDLRTVSRMLIMSELTPLVVGAARRVLHGRTRRGRDGTDLRLVASYGYGAQERCANRFALGEGLVGQAALEKKPIMVKNAPDDYIQITSGLGEAAPANIIVLPVLFEDEVMAVIELASFGRSARSI